MRWHRQDQHPEPISWVILIVAALISLIGPSLLQADLIKLSNGGELRGRIIKNPMNKGAAEEWIHLETLTGARVVVHQSDTQFVTIRSLTVEEYEGHAKRAVMTVESQWQLAEWCRQKSLSQQRQVHLMEIVEIDPTHAKAQAALGRVWHNGEWIDRDELMASRGYVKYKGRYVTTQELDVFQQTTDELDQERAWYKKIKLWHGWLVGAQEERRKTAVNALKQVRDTHAAPALIRYLCESSNADVRLLGSTVLSTMAGHRAVSGLVKLTLLDVDSEVRFVSLNGIQPENFESAQPVFIKELKSASNTVVGRAAVALVRVGDSKAIAPLIDALITTHRYKVRSDEPVGETYSFGTDGSFASGSDSRLPPDVELALRTGQLPQGVIVLPSPTTANLQKKMVLVKVQHRNHDVLTALRKMTQQDFGYEKRTWHLWWAAEKTVGGSDKPFPKK